MKLAYYAAIPEGRKWIELLVRREDGRQVAEERTGVVYRSAREMTAALSAKNSLLQMGR